MLGIRSFQAAAALLAGVSAAASLFWLATSPEPISPAKNELGFFAFLLFHRDLPWAGYSAYYASTLGLLAVTTLFASILAIFLAMKVSDRIEMRRLALSLALGATSAAYFFFVTTTPALRTLVGWTPVSPWRVPLDFLAYLATVLSPLLLARFFLGYPRAATEDEWKAHIRRNFASAREAAQRGDWHDRLLPARLRERLASPPGTSGWLRGLSEEALVARQYRFVRLLQSRGVLVGAGTWALLVASLDWLDASGIAGSPRLTGMSKGLAFLLYVPFAAITANLTIESLKLGGREAFDEDRRKIDWIRSALVVGGTLASFVFPFTFVCAPLYMRHIAEESVVIPAKVLMLGPAFVAFVLLMLIFLVALALSIFYRGALDPRLAARKVTLLGAIGLIVTFLFVLLERTVAAKLASLLGLSPDSGALIAGAAVASTFVPVRDRTEKAVNALVGRWLPLDSLIEGERKALAVAISDLSGYTALSSRDEKQALLLAALLQRQAAKLVQTHGGRIVKSMGDAVLLAFDDAPSATRVLLALHRDFGPAAEQLGLEPLAVHSGAHWGQVTVAHDGDIYGQTVNVAARIQSSAGSAQIVVSKVFADLAREAASFRELGSRCFKNVAEPVPCEELAAA